MAKRYHDGSGMIRSNKSEMANMPQEVKMKMYPKASHGLDCMYRDNQEGIDAYARENHKKIMKQKMKASDAS